MKFLIFILAITAIVFSQDTTVVVNVSDKGIWSFVYSNFLPVLSGIGAMFSIYFFIFSKIKKSIHNLYVGVSIFIKDNENEVWSEFKQLVILPSDKLLEDSASLLEKMNMKKAGKRLRDLIDGDKYSKE